MRKLIGICIAIALSVSLIPRQVEANKCVKNEIELTYPKDKDKVDLGGGGIWAFGGTVSPENSKVKFEVLVYDKGIPEVAATGSCAVKGEIFAWAFAKWEPCFVEVKVYLADVPSVTHIIDIELLPPIIPAGIEDDPLALFRPFKRLRGKFSGCRG